MNISESLLSNTRIALNVSMVSIVTLVACNTLPARNVALDLAHSRYDQAQTQSQVAKLAPVEFKLATEALAAADQAQSSGAAIEVVDHLAYLASQRTRIAKQIAEIQQSQTLLEGATAERDRMRLAQRTQEADTAQRQLNQSQQANTSMAQALVASQQDNAVQAAQLDDLAAQLRDINARKTDRGMVVTIGDLLFATGQSQLQGEGQRTMVKLAEFMQRNPQRRAVIEGFTDSVGSSTSNQALSDRRARVVMDALLNLGVANARLTTQAYGETRPIASNDNATGRQLNRRVEIVFSPEAGDLMLK